MQSHAFFLQPTNHQTQGWDYCIVIEEVANVSMSKLEQRQGPSPTHIDCFISNTLTPWLPTLHPAQTFYFIPSFPFLLLPFHFWKKKTQSLGKLNTELINFSSNQLVERSWNNVWEIR
ncbi:hypothetical protein ABFS83_14G315600 [Erythranthe nasuta]